MKLPVISGVIDRRILINYRVDQQILKRLVPCPFRPKLVAGFGMAGICLIRLRALRPRFLPPLVGLSSDNAAHRIAVEWTENGVPRSGVYVARRDTNSRFNVLAGGRIFPGIHHRARFAGNELADDFQVHVESYDRLVRIMVDGKVANDLPPTSVFASPQEASEFFRSGSLGFSPTRDLSHCEGLELACRNWSVSPLAVTNVRSSYFDDDEVFPRGSIEFDCALLMQNIEHQWHSRPPMLVRAVADRN